MSVTIMKETEEVRKEAIILLDASVNNKLSKNDLENHLKRIIRLCDDLLGNEKILSKFGRKFIEILDK